MGKLLIFLILDWYGFIKNVLFPKPMIQDPLYDKKQLFKYETPSKKSPYIALLTFYSDSYWTWTWSDIAFVDKA